MRNLVLAALIALVGLVPAAVSAQTPPSAKPPTAAPAVLPAQTDDTSRVLAIGLGAISGMVTLTVISGNLISRTALASLGQGALVFIGTALGGMTGNWFYNREHL